MSWLFSKPGSATRENHHWRAGGKRGEEGRGRKGGRQQASPGPRRDGPERVTWLTGPCLAHSGWAAPWGKHRCQASLQQWLAQPKVLE